MNRLDGHIVDRHQVVISVGKCRGMDIDNTFDFLSLVGRQGKSHPEIHGFICRPVFHLWSVENQHIAVLRHGTRPGEILRETGEKKDESDQNEKGLFHNQGFQLVIKLLLFIGAHPADVSLTVKCQQAEMYQEINAVR